MRSIEASATATNGSPSEAPVPDLGTSSPSRKAPSLARAIVVVVRSGSLSGVGLLFPPLHDATTHAAVIRSGVLPRRRSMRELYDRPTAGERKTTEWTRLSPCPTPI
jgi:hypothetical protein